jgi:hypothetical protein
MVHFFSLRQKKQNKALVGDAVYPNLIGRNVLEQLSLGYCQTSLYLFVTKQIGDYRAVLDANFPKPPDIDVFGNYRFPE